MTIVRKSFVDNREIRNLAWRLETIEWWRRYDLCRSRMSRTFYGKYLGQEYTHQRFFDEARHITDRRI